MEGKIALVTGGAGGIGSAICRLFASEGAKVVVADVDAGRGEGVVTEITGSGGEAVYIDLDVTKEEDWVRASCGYGGAVRGVERAGEQCRGLQPGTGRRHAAGDVGADHGGECHGDVPREQACDTGDEEVGWGIDCEYIVGCGDRGQRRRNGLRPGQGAQSGY